MPIYDNNGSVNSLIGKVYDHNGSVQSAISKVYDNNGSVNSLVYQDGIPLFDNGDQCTAITGGWRTEGNDFNDPHRPSYALIDKDKIRLYFKKYGNYNQWVFAIQNTTFTNPGFSTIAVTYSVDTREDSTNKFYIRTDLGYTYQFFNLVGKEAGVVYTAEFQIAESTLQVSVGINSSSGATVLMTVYKVELK